MKKLLKSLFLLLIVLANISFAHSEKDNDANTIEKNILQLEWKHQFEYAGFYAAIYKGYYKDIGIELEIKEFEENTKICEDVITQKATYGIAASSLILERIKNKPVVLVASYFKQNALVLVVKPEIKRPSDLRNKNIMIVEDQLNNTSLAVMIKDSGLNSRDYNLVKHDFKLDKFINNEIDAFSAFSTSQLFELDQLGIKYNILNPSNFGIYSYDVELFTCEKNIKENFNKVKKFVEATNKGWEYAFANKHEIVDLIYNKYSKEKTKEALLDEANKTEEIFKTNIFKIGSIIPELIKLNADMYLNVGLISDEYDLNTIINDYYIPDKKSSTIKFTKEEKEFIEQHNILKVHNESSWPPFNYRVNHKPMGFSIDYMNLLASKTGLNIEYISGFTWNEFIEKMKKNEIDIMLNIAKSEDREKYLEFTSPYEKVIDTVFVKKDNNTLKSLDDFKGKTLAVLKGFYEEEVLKKLYPEIKFLIVDDSLEGLKKVIFGEADGVFDRLAVGNYFLENHYITNLKPGFEILDSRFSKNIHLAVSKNNLILRNILEKGKEKISQDEMLELKRKWLKENETKKNISLSNKEDLYLVEKGFISMCVNPQFEPFEMLDSFGNYLGISADIIKLISDRLNIEIKLIATKNWEESIDFSKSKKCDILSFLNETPKRKEWLDFTDKIFTDDNVIIGRVETPLIGDLSKIKASIALTKESSLYEKIRNDFPNLVIIPTDTQVEAFKYVEQKKADLTIASLIMSAHTIKQYGLFNLKILNHAEKYEKDFKIATHKDDLYLKEILNKAISSISEDEIKQIVNKWVAIKYEKDFDYTYLFIILGVISVVIAFLFYRQYILKHTNNYLQAEVKKRTAQVEKSNMILNKKQDELYDLNKNLEEKIKEEIEKNKRIQEKLFKADKLASMGEMISNIAHQWRQPLSVISTIATGVKLQKEMNSLKDTDLIENMDLINKNAQYLSKTIDDFKDFIKENKDSQFYSLSDAITSFSNIIYSSIKDKNIKVIMDLNKEIIIEGNSNQLIQCLINIFNNSKDALLEKKQEESLIFISTEKEDDKVYLKIKDNAGGISQEILSKIYDPYFTTKHQSQGTGLGLHLTYRLITESMQGKIDASNVEYVYMGKRYKGIEFKITFNV